VFEQIEVLDLAPDVEVDTLDVGVGVEYDLVELRIRIREREMLELRGHDEHAHFFGDAERIVLFAEWRHVACSRLCGEGRPRGTLEMQFGQHWHQVKVYVAEVTFDVKCLHLRRVTFDENLAAFL